MARKKKAKKKVTKKKVTKATKKKVTTKKPVKKTAKKKAAAKRKVSKKKTSAKKKVAKKAAPKKKVAKKKVAKKSTAKKKTAKKKIAKKKVTKKSSTKKKTAKKPATKKTSAKKIAKKASKKKAVAKKPTKKTTKKVVKKKVAPKKAPTKKPAKSKTTGKIAPPKKTRRKKTEVKAAPVVKKPKSNIPAVPTKVAVARVRDVKPEKRKKNNDALKPSNFGPIHGVDPYRPIKGEEYMSKGMQGHFREVLHAWKRELMEEVDRTMDHMQDDAANFPDPSDRATQESEFSLELRTRDRERKLLKKIGSSLEDITVGDYGYCEACGIEIGLRRLEARPTAGLCIDCKTLDEIREKQRGK